MRPTDAKAAIHVLVQSNTPGIFWSGPGCGKSRIAEQLAAEMEKEYLAMRLPDEFSVLMGLDSAAANERIMQVKAADPWMKKHKHVLMRKSA